MGKENLGKNSIFLNYILYLRYKLFRQLKFIYFKVNNYNIYNLGYNKNRLYYTIHFKFSKITCIMRKLYINHKSR